MNDLQSWFSRLLSPRISRCRRIRRAPAELQGDFETNASNVKEHILTMQLLSDEVVWIIVAINNVNYKKDRHSLTIINIVMRCFSHRNWHRFLSTHFRMRLRL